MAFKDFTESLMAKAKKVNLFHKEGDNQRGAMPNGGTTGYYPNSKAPDLFAEHQEPAAEQNRQPEQQMPPQSGSAMGGQPQQPYQQQGAQQPNDPVSAYTSSFGGFSAASWQYGTGRQQPVNSTQQPNVQTQQSWTGYNQPVNSTQQPNAQTQQGWTGYNQPVNSTQQPNAQMQQGWTGYNQPVNSTQQPNAQMQQSWTGYNQPVNSTQQPNAQMQQGWTGYNQPMYGGQQGAGASQEAESPRSRRAAKRQAQQPQEKISYMPNRGANFVDESGSAFMHTERVVQLLNVAASFRVIDFMRNNESIVVNIESIANETETQRCLDLLAGAAFTMGCSMTKITQHKHAYLFAPKSVLVLADDSVQSWTARDGAYEQRNAESQEQYRPVRGAYVPDRPDEQRRDMYQEQQERARSGYTSQQRAYTQGGYTGQQPYAQNGYTGQQRPYSQGGYTGQ